MIFVHMYCQETVAILSHAGVDLKDVVHADDETFGPLKHLVMSEDDHFRVILVDHNEAYYIVLYTYIYISIYICICEQGSITVLEKRQSQHGPFGHHI